MLGNPVNRIPCRDQAVQVQETAEFGSLGHLQKIDNNIDADKGEGHNRVVIGGRGIANRYHGLALI